MAKVLLDRVFEHILEISLAMSSVILLLLLISGKTARVYRAKWKYWAWLVIAVRLAIPVNTSLPSAPAIETALIPLYQTVDLGSTDYHTDTHIGNPLSGDTMRTTSPVQIPTASTERFLSFASIVYIRVAVLFFLFHIAGYFIFIARTKRWRIPDTAAQTAEMLRTLQSEMNIKRNLTIYRCAEIDTPTTAGFFRTAIFLPSQGAYSDTQLEMILRHELAHCKRHDLWYKLLLLVVNAMHWFNPFVYLAVRQAEYDLETSCDETVLQARSAMFRTGYAEALLSIMQGSRKKQVLLSTSFYPGTKRVKQRFENILDSGKKHKGSVALVFLALCVIVAGTLITWSGGKEKPGVHVWVSIQSLTENEYSEVGTSAIDNPSINDFKKLSVLVDVRGIPDRTIRFPSLQDVRRLLSSDVVWYGNYGSQDNDSEDFAHYWIEAVLFTRNTSDDEIRRKLNSLHTDISYKDEQGNEKKETYPLGGSLASYRNADMTQNRVIELARKGDALTFADFAPYHGMDVSSDLNDHIMVYGVDGGYRLVVGTDGTRLDRVDLESIWESGGSGIDIRHNDVGEFIKSHPSNEAKE